MIFLGRDEAARWRSLGALLEEGAVTPGRRPEGVRQALLPHFHFYAGILRANAGRGGEAISWFREGGRMETDGNSANRSFADFMERHGGELRVPEAVFADPHPYLPFTEVPVIRESRERLVVRLIRSLPDVAAPFRFLDIGCGDGSLTVASLRGLRDAGRIGEIDFVTLVDPSSSMLELATATVMAAFPGICVMPLQGRFQDVSADLPESDVALAAISIHHMPREERRIHLERLAPRIGHLILFELNADHDTPELNSPELAVSIYQSYGAMFKVILAHDAPRELKEACVDRFFLAEAITMLTQPRGKRGDYHMLRSQWQEHLAETLGPEFTCHGEFTDCVTDHSELITLHYGRG